jgi:xylulokinase
MPVVAGVDSSTQSCTVLLRDADDGRIVGHATAPHPRTTPPVSEQDPAAWWAALGRSFGSALGSAPHPALGSAAAPAGGDLAALSVDGQAHGLVALDAAGTVIRPAKLWNDTTSSGEARDLVARLGAGTWARRTGSVPVGAHTITKLLWLARHEPESFRRLGSVLNPHDWLNYRLTGAPATDRGEASGTGYFSPAESAWQADLLTLVDEATDWAALLPVLLGPAEPAGEVTAAAAADLGVRGGIPVGPGTADNMAAALGLGVGTGDVVISLGTSGTVYAPHPLPTADTSGAVNGNADATGGFLPLVCTLNAAKVTDAFARLLGVDHDRLATLALAAPAPPDRPVLAAFLDGERVPDRPGATGLLAGLRSDLAREQLARAAYEGVLAGLAMGLAALVRVGVDVGGRLLLTGGAARSPAYRQLAADLLGRPVHVVALAETAAAGAAVQAAAVLHGAPVAEVAKSWAPPAPVVAEPRAGQSADEFLDRYRRLAAWDALDDQTPLPPLRRS